MGRTVLTAAHVVAGEPRVQIRGVDKVAYAATLDPAFVGDSGGSGPDLALLEVDGSFGEVLPAMSLAAVDRDSENAMPVARCHAIGYPWFAERPSPDVVRDTVDAYGEIPVGSRLVSGLLSLQVSSSPRPLPPSEKALGRSEWSGMSGAPVVADGYLLGVVSEHAAREGPSAITVTPLTALEPDPTRRLSVGVANPSAWWARLGADVRESDGLRRLPVQRTRAEPAYWATVREIQSRTSQLVGRQKELREIAEFATGPGGYQWLVGDPWVGKTALLAEAVVAALPGHVDVVSYFLSRREADADLNQFLTAVVPQLVELLDESTPQVADLRQFRSLWRRAEQKAADRDRELLLVVDGLDEDLNPPGTLSVAAGLPAVTSDRAHVLMSSRPHPELPRDVPVGHSLRTVEPLTVAPFEGAAALAELAAQEIDQLVRRDTDGFASGVLGVLAAAGGPLTVADLARLTSDPGRLTPLYERRVGILVTEEGARSLQRVGPAPDWRYQFAHASLLEYAQADPVLSNSYYRDCIHEWAEHWRAAGWPISVAPCRTADDSVIPRYLLESYPRTLYDDAPRLAALCSDVGWISAAVQAVGVDAVLVYLRTATSASPTDARLRTVCAMVEGQAHHLRDLVARSDPRFVPRQLCLQAAELADDTLAAACRDRLLDISQSGFVPQWTTRRASPALVAELDADGGIHVMEVLPGGRFVTGGDDGWVLVWDPDRPDLEPIELDAHDPSCRGGSGALMPGAGVSALSVLPDGRFVTGGGNDGWVRIWDPDQPEANPIERPAHDGRVSVILVLPDGRFVTGGGDDGRVLVWDPDQMDVEPVQLAVHDDGVSTISLLPDERLVIGSNRGGKVVVWDPEQADVVPIELNAHDGSVGMVLVLADGRLVTGGDRDGRVLVWDPDRLDAEPIELGSHDSRLWTMAVLTDGRRLVTGHGDGQGQLWDVDLPEAEPIELGAHDSGVKVISLLPDGRFVTSGRDGRVRVWNPDRLASRSHELVTHDQWPVMRVLPDGRIITGDNDGGRLRVWDTNRFVAEPSETSPGDSEVQVASLLPDGRVITGGRNGRVRVWEPGSPEPVPLDLGAHDGPVLGLALLPDGRFVTAGRHDGRVLVWDPDRPSDEPLDLGTHDSASKISVLSDGRIVTVGGSDNGRVRVWDPGKPAAGPLELGGHSNVNAIAVLHDGRFVTGAGRDRPLMVWDPDRPAAGPLELSESSEGVVRMAVLNDGRIATGGTMFDGLVRLWDPRRPDLGPLDMGRHEGEVTGLAALPDGRFATCSEDGQVLVWNPDDPRPRRVPLILGEFDDGLWDLAVLDRQIIVSDSTRLYVLNIDTPDRIEVIALDSAGLTITKSINDVCHLIVTHFPGGLTSFALPSTNSSTSNSSVTDTAV